MIALWCVQLVLYVGFAGIYILIAAWTRGSSFGIALGTFSGCGLTNMIYSGVNLLINKIGIVYQSIQRWIAIYKGFGII